jgi:hypothetical protein
MDSALAAVDELIRRDPAHRDAMMSGVGIALRFGMKDRAAGYLKAWLAAHPNDTSVKRAIEELEMLGDSSRGEAPDTALGARERTGE